MRPVIDGWKWPDAGKDERRFHGNPVALGFCASIPESLAPKQASCSNWCLTRKDSLAQPSPSHCRRLRARATLSMP